MNRLAGSIIYDVDTSYYGKFLQNEKKIRSLAAANPNSYAAVVVRSVDHLLTAKQIMREHRNQPIDARCTQMILRELSTSFRASEIFGLWRPKAICKIRRMANESIHSERSRTSELDRDARVCLVVVNQTDMEEKILFVDACRKKYPNEVLFQRIYSDLFNYTRDWDSGLLASEEVSALFPTHPDVLNSRAGLLRLATDTGKVNYTHWTRQKNQIEAMMEAHRQYLQFAPKDHRFFAVNNYAMAYLLLKYANPSSLLSQSDLQDISVYFLNGWKAEMDILPCFLPFNSSHKEFVARAVNVQPKTCIYAEPSIGMAAHSRRKTPENRNLIDLHRPSQRRIDMSVAFRRRFRDIKWDQPTDGDRNTDTAPVNLRTDDLEEIRLHQMKLARVSKKFAAKVIHLTVVENSIFCVGLVSDVHIETIVADTTGDFIKLQLYFGEKHTYSETRKQLMNRFQFGTEWKLCDPDFHMDNGDEGGMYIRATPECFIPIRNDDGLKCRMCFKRLTARKICSNCKVAAYCGEVCQMQDWKYLKHKYICLYRRSDE